MARGALKVARTRGGQKKRETGIQWEDSLEETSSVLLALLLAESAAAHFASWRKTGIIRCSKPFLHLLAALRGATQTGVRLTTTFPKLPTPAAPSLIMTTMAGWISISSTAADAISLIPHRRCAMPFTTTIVM